MVSDLRHALTEALGPLYRVEREVRPIGDYRLFVATQSPPTPNAPQLLIKVLPSALSLGIDDLQFERSVLLLAEKLGSNTNSIYKLLHDARKKLRRGLEASGFTVEDVREAWA